MIRFSIFLLKVLKRIYNFSSHFKCEGIHKSLFAVYFLLIVSSQVVQQKRLVFMAKNKMKKINFGHKTAEILPTTNNKLLNEFCKER